jgi:hypothetical protein
MVAKRPIKLGHMAEKALELLRQRPEGLTMAQMREALEATAESQEHFNRRIREIRKLFELKRTVIGGVSVYVLGDRRVAPTADGGQVSEKLRAAVMHMAHGRCQMCGRTIKEDGVRLQADHKIPQSWGGPTTLENLWAICEACNRGKRNYFATFDGEEMKKVVNIDSVHERIAQFLRLHKPEPVPAYAIEFVANVKDQQLDWRKRLRELRYEPIGLEIEMSKKKDQKGVQSFYALQNWRDLPADHVKLIKEFEKRSDR